MISVDIQSDLRSIAQQRGTQGTPPEQILLDCYVSFLSSLFSIALPILSLFFSIILFFSCLFSPFHSLSLCPHSLSLSFFLTRRNFSVTIICSILPLPSILTTFSFQFPAVIMSARYSYITGWGPAVHNECRAEEECPPELSVVLTTILGAGEEGEGR